MIGFVAERPMALAVQGLTGAGHGERSPKRLAQRDGHRDRVWATRAGTVELGIPKPRKGSDFPGFLEPRRVAGKALTAVIQEAHVPGISTRPVDQLVEALGMAGISRSQVSRLGPEIDARVRTFLERPIEGDSPHLWIDATYVKVREGIEAAVARVLRATWQRCRARFMRNALAHAGKSGRRVVSALGATALAQEHADAAKAQWRQVADQVRTVRTKLPELAALLGEAEEGVLAHMSLPKEHRAEIHSTNPLERVDGEIERRTQVVGLGGPRARFAPRRGRDPPGRSDPPGAERRIGRPARPLHDRGNDRALER